MVLPREVRPWLVGVLWALGEAQSSGDGDGGNAAAYHQMMYPAEVGILSAARLLQSFAGQPVAGALQRIYPEQALYPLVRAQSEVWRGAWTRVTLGRF